MGFFMALWVLFSMVTRTGHPEDNSSNWCTGAVLGTCPKSDYISFVVPAPTVLVSYWRENMTQDFFPSGRFWLCDYQPYSGYATTDHIPAA